MIDINILLGLLLVATLADHVTTNMALKRGLVERNPVLAKVIKQWGSTGLFLTKLVLWGLIVALNKFVMPYPELVMVSIGVFSAISIFNLYQIKKVGK